mmetsp:Transcript_87217/g.219587  ORF Transcript_87217/g.219587 Transcript_87217/m.219587 type:complete len:152 (+) Transcript_87217:69-524(+)
MPRQDFLAAILVLSAVVGASALGDPRSAAAYAAATRPATAEADSSGDFGLLYIIAALFVAAGAIGAKEALDGRIRFCREAGGEQALAEVSLLEAGVITTGAEEAGAVTATATLPSLLTGATCKDREATKTVKPVATAVDVAGTGVEGVEDR